MKLSSVVLYLVLFGLATEVVVLGLHKRKQKETITQLLAGQASPEPGTVLEPGDRLEPLPELTAPDGTRQRLLFGEAQPYRLLFVFNTRCPACGEAIPSWNRLTRSLGDGLRPIGVTSDTVDEIVEYGRHRDLAYPLRSLGDTDYKDVFQVHFVPHTILVDPSGIVLGVWSGPPGPDQERRVENLFAAVSGLSAE